MYWQSYATAKVLKDYLPVDIYIAGCMPRPEAIIEGLQDLMDDIKNGQGNSWERYFQNYDHYLGNQQKLFGEDWQTPTDIIAEARHYDLLTENTLGEHTVLLEKHQRPLEALEMRLHDREKQSRE
jgi:NADH-quinone oxidoreductase subunit B